MGPAAHTGGAQRTRCRTQRLTPRAHAYSHKDMHNPTAQRFFFFFYFFRNACGPGASV